VLHGKILPGFLPGKLYGSPVYDGIRPGEIDVFKDANGAFFRLGGVGGGYPFSPPRSGGSGGL